VRDKIALEGSIVTDKQSNPWFLLLVDDSDSVLSIMARIAAMIPYLDVATAYSAEAALPIAQARTPDLVISDLMMPGHDGLWLLKQLRKGGILCPFIVLTGCHDAGSVIDLYRAGAVRYLMKPSPVGDVYQTIVESLPPPMVFEFNTTPGSRVHVAGDFNDWNTDQFELSENPEPGHYQVTIPLSRGRHQYKFIVNDRWVCDPKQPEKTVTDQGHENSVITVRSPFESPLVKGLVLP